MNVDSGTRWQSGSWGGSLTGAPLSLEQCLLCGYHSTTRFYLPTALRLVAAVPPLDVHRPQGPKILAAPLVGETMHGSVTWLLLHIMALPRGGLLPLPWLWLLLLVMALGGLLPPPPIFLAWLWWFDILDEREEKNKKILKMGGPCRTLLRTLLMYGARKMIQILLPRLPLLWPLEEDFWWIVLFFDSSFLSCDSRGVILYPSTLFCEYVL